MIIFGASGHAKVISDCLNENDSIVLFFDDDPSKNSFMGIPVKPYDPLIFPDEPVVLAIGNNLHRFKVAHKILHKFGLILNSGAVIAKSVHLGEGTVVLHNSVIQAESVIGKHCIVNTSASIDHECVIDDFVHISPNATLCGNVKVGEGTHIGAAAVILPSVKIGKWSVIGAGSVITQNVPDYSMYFGNPGRFIKNIPHE